MSEKHSWHFQTLNMMFDNQSQVTREATRRRLLTRELNHTNFSRGIQTIQSFLNIITQPLTSHESAESDHTSHEGKNHTISTSNEYQNHTISTPHEYQYHTILTSHEYQNHTVLASHEYQNHTILTSHEYQNHTVLTSHEYQNHTILTSHEGLKPYHLDISPYLGGGEKPGLKLRFFLCGK